ncbi:hypothetical protein FXO37_00895 [Capsicum annuum]|nr:hypothetical protein FXO37_00895 [Capsicum annuum]
MSATVDLSNGRYLPISGTTTYVISYGKRQTRGKASEAAFSSYLEVGCTDSPTGYLFRSISVSSLSLSLRSLLAGALSIRKESKGDKAKDRGRTPSLNVKGSSFSRDLKMDYTKRMDRMSEMVDSIKGSGYQSRLVPRSSGFRIKAWASATTFYVRIPLLSIFAFSDNQSVARALHPSADALVSPNLWDIKIHRYRPGEDEVAGILLGPFYITLSAAQEDWQTLAEIYSRTTPMHDSPYHIHVFTIHVTVLILLKGVLFARSSHLIPDKENLGFRFPCDGPGRGGTCQVPAWDHVFLGLFWMYNSISLYCIRLVIRLPCPVRTVWSVTTQPERKPFLIGSFPGESCYALALIGKGLVHVRNLDCDLHVTGSEQSSSESITGRWLIVVHYLTKKMNEEACPGRLQEGIYINSETVPRELTSGNSQACRGRNKSEKDRAKSVFCGPVSLSRSEKWIVGTGLERQAALDSGALTIAEREERVVYTSTDMILLAASSMVSKLDDWYSLDGRESIEDHAYKQPFPSSFADPGSIKPASSILLSPGLTELGQRTTFLELPPYLDRSFPNSNSDQLASGFRAWLARSGNSPSSTWEESFKKKGLVQASDTLLQANSAALLSLARLRRRFLT